MDISGLFYFSFYYGEILACLCKEIEYVWVAWSFYSSAFFLFIYFPVQLQIYNKVLNHLESLFQVLVMIKQWTWLYDL